MEPSRDLRLSQRRLARRLRALREEHWPGVRVTQSALAAALGQDRQLGDTLISSWESQTNPKLPPPHRLRAYATFFATQRSVAAGGPRLLDEAELTEQERRDRDALAEELLALRAAAAGDGVEVLGPPPRRTWLFEDGAPVVIVCGEVPVEQRPTYASPDNPNFVELLRYADLDALMELRGHVRAENPRSGVFFRLGTQLRADDVSGHVVLLGGSWFNPATAWFAGRLHLPIEQVTNSADQRDTFVRRDGSRRRFEPVFDQGGLGLVEDVGLLVRTPNPLNAARTLTICGGVYTRGVLGAVRCLTDAQLRERNEAYLAERFDGSRTFGLLMRVPVLDGGAITPDLQIPDNRLLEWSEPR
jgi:hypothetical protein